LAFVSPTSHQAAYVASEGHGVSAGAEAPRLGITVSRRVGGAVVRNRVKRFVREAFRQRKHMFPPGWDIVIVAKASASMIGYPQIASELQGISCKLIPLQDEPRGT